jgi:hypothetical protein
MLKMGQWLGGCKKTLYFRSSKKMVAVAAEKNYVYYQ